MLLAARYVANKKTGKMYWSQFGKCSLVVSPMSYFRQTPADDMGIKPW